MKRQKRQKLMMSILAGFLALLMLPAYYSVMSGKKKRQVVLED